MKKLLLLLLIAGTAYADGPLFRYKETDTDQEFQNTYQSIRSPSIDFGTAKRLNITTSTIQSLAVSTITFVSSATIKNLTITGTLAGVTSSKWIQYSAGTDLAGAATTSSTYQSTSLTASITPTSASNKVFVWVSTTLRSDITAKQAQLAVFRGATQITAAEGANGESMMFTTVGGDTLVPATFFLIDSPLTASATTYTLKLRNTDNISTVEQGKGTPRSTILLVEIAS